MSADGGILKCLWLDFAKLDSSGATSFTCKQSAKLNITHIVHRCLAAVVLDCRVCPVSQQDFDDLARFVVLARCAGSPGRSHRAMQRRRARPLAWLVYLRAQAKQGFDGCWTSESDSVMQWSDPVLVSLLNVSAVFEKRLDCSPLAFRGGIPLAAHPGQITWLHNSLSAPHPAGRGSCSLHYSRRATLLYPLRCAGYTAGYGPNVTKTTVRFVGTHPSDRRAILSRRGSMFGS